MTFETVGLTEKGSLFSEESSFMTGICLVWKLKEYSNDHTPNAPNIHMF